MNNEAEITRFQKSIIPFQDLSINKDASISWSKKEALERVKEFTNSEHSPSQSYKNAFLLYDKE